MNIPHFRIFFPRRFHIVFGAVICLFFLFSGAISKKPVFAQSPAGIQGRVFRDFNANGSFDTSADYNEIGVPGIGISAYGIDGTLAGSATSAADGTYSLTLPNGAYRVEFTGYSAPDFPGAQGAGSGSSVQFVTAPQSAVNFGINYPAQYCQENPKMCTPLFTNGDPLQNGTAATARSFVSFRYDGSNVPQNPDADATGAQTGAVWSVAVQHKTFDVYTAAFVKRHSGLGTLGEGGIYRLSYNPDNVDAAPSLSPWLDVTTLGLNVGLVGSGATVAERNISRGLNPIKTMPTSTTARDLQGYEGVGRIGLGGLAISDDGNTLYFVNLYQKTLNALRIDSDNNRNTAPTSADLQVFPIPNPDCQGGEARPFALKAYRGRVYVGVVCDASTSQLTSDLKAAVLSFDGSTFGNLFSMRLDYARQNGPDYLYGACHDSLHWRPWTTSIIEPCTYIGFYLYPQPVLATMEFDVDGSLILGFMDRGSHQFGYKNTPPKQLPFSYKDEYYATTAGDTLRVCLLNGEYQLEGTGSCPQHIDSAYPYNPGAGGNSGISEFYHEDVLRAHLETSLGGIGFLPGSGEIVTTAIDPYGTIAGSGGVNWFSNVSGLSRPSGYVIYEGGNDQAGNFSKAGGLGDIDLLCDSAPVEIGNRVWLDSDKDGIQDAGEPALAGVQVELVENGLVIATATTDANGNYLFSNLASGTDTPAFRYGLDLREGVSYQVRISIPTQSASGQPLAGLSLATPNSAGDTSNSLDSDRLDSDGVLDGTTAVVTAIIGSAGQNNHGYDFGFVLLDTPTPTNTASATPTPTSTRDNVTPPIYEEPSETPSLTPIVSATASMTPSATASMTSSVTASVTPSVTNTATSTLVPSATVTPSFTPTSTFTATASTTSTTGPSATPSLTSTPSLTPSVTPTFTATNTPSATPLVSLTPLPPTIAKQANVTVARPGDVVSWTINIYNPSGVTLAPVSVYDMLDARLSFLSASTSKGTVSVNGQQILVSLESLNAGESVQIVLQTRVRENTVVPTVIPNQATLLTPRDTIVSNPTIVTIVPPYLPQTGNFRSAWVGWWRYFLPFKFGCGLG